MRIGIVGAGIAGLTAAYELGKQGHQVTLFEAQAIPGGLSSGFRVPGWDWTLDRFYRHIFAGDRAIVALAEELGAALTFSRPTTSLWVDGHPYPYDSPIAAALYPRLPLHHNLRAGMVIAYLKYLVRDGTVLEHTTAHSWLRRTMGTRAYSELWEPMLRGKFKAYSNQVNMAWFWARIAARTPRLGYFDGGFQVFVDRLVDGVRSHGGAVHLETPVDGIAQEGRQVALTLAGGQRERFDQVLTTTSPHRLRDMVADLPAAYAAHLSGLRSTGTVVLILALSRSILTDGTYWLNLPAGEFPCLAMVEHTNYQDAAHYGGDVIVYLGDYLPLDAPEMAMDTDALYQRYRPALLRVRPEFEDSWVRARWSFREAYAQPVPLIDHSHHVPKLELPVLPNLYWASMHHVYPWDRGTNYAVEVGQRIAQVMGA
ncbi:MAG: NAD(P)/FAD-dependent oxidoreductase [Anaerolineae bacterium]|nr:NAD(P)/FAD-dependent oxidoreductase [Anaerolineae bacterium]